MLEWRDKEYGIVLGRMQPIHIGHLEYLDAARAIGITNPDISDMIDDVADADRSRQDHNPFTYFARAEMIAASMLDRGWNCQEFTVVPADVNRPSLLKANLPSPDIATVFTTVYDEWGDRKSQIMDELGYRVDVLWRRTMDDRVTSGTELRLAMRSGAAWKHLVPGAVSRYLEQVDGAALANGPGQSDAPSRGQQ